MSELNNLYLKIGELTGITNSLKESIDLVLISQEKMQRQINILESRWVKQGGILVGVTTVGVFLGYILSYFKESIMRMF